MAVTAEALAEMCGSSHWRRLMLEQPECSLASPSATQLRAASERCFDELTKADWLEAFAAHSMIGAPRRGDVTGNREQAGLDGADGELRTALAAANVEYQLRFGFVFLIRARGRSGEEMLAALRERLENSPDAELANAAGEQREITALRLAALAEGLVSRGRAQRAAKRGVGA